MNSGTNLIDVIIDKEWLYEVYNILSSEKKYFESVKNESLLKLLIGGKKKIIFNFIFFDKKNK